MVTEKKTGGRGRPSTKKESNAKIENSKPEDKEPKEPKETKESKWKSTGEGNIMFTVNEKGILFIRVNLNKVYKPSSSFYKEEGKRKTNILVASTSGNKKLLNGEFANDAISVNIYRPMTEGEIKEWEGK